MAVSISPTPTTTDQLSGEGTKTFTNPDNVLSDDTDRATYSTGTTGLTNTLVVSEFGTDSGLPSDAYITGLTLTVKAHKSNGLPAPGVVFNKAALVIDGVEGDDLSDSDVLGTSADEEFTFGSSSSDWGFTRSQLDSIATSDNLQVNLQFNVTSGGGSSGYIAFVGIEVHYRRYANSPPRSLAFTGTKFKHSGYAQLTKKTTESLDINQPVSSSNLPPEVIDVPHGADGLIFNLISDAAAVFQYLDVWGYYPTVGDCYIPVQLANNITCALPSSTAIGSDLADVAEDVISTDEPFGTLAISAGTSVNGSEGIGASTNGCVYIPLKGATKIYINPQNNTATYSYTFGTFTQGEAFPQKR